MPIGATSNHCVSYRTVLLGWFGAATVVVALMAGAFVFRLEYDSELTVSRAWIEATALQLAQSIGADATGETPDVEALQGSVREAYLALEQELVKREGWPRIDEVIHSIAIADQTSGERLASMPENATDVREVPVDSVWHGSGAPAPVATGSQGGFRTTVPIESAIGGRNLAIVIDARPTYAWSVLQEATLAAVAVCVLGLVICGTISLVLARWLSTATQRMRVTVEDLASGRYSARLKTRTRVRELRALEDGLNHLASELEVGADLARQVDIAEAIQRHLLPSQSGSLQHAEYCGIVRFSDQVGGDIFDIVEHDGKVYILVADVVGHGLGASLLASLCHGAFFVSLREGNCELDECVGWLNRLLCHHQYAGSFVTAFAAAYSPDSESLDWISAGHEPVRHLAAQGSTKELTSQCGPLGIDRNAAFSVSHLDVQGGDTLIAWTDGVRERRNVHGDFLGSKALEDVVGRSRHLSPDALVQAVVEAEESFAAGRRAGDDSTIVAVRFVDREGRADTRGSV